MNLLKEQIKTLLIKKQHKRYTNELSSKKMTYDKWIEDQEKRLNIIPKIEIREENKLTIDRITEDFGIEKKENAGYASKYEKKCRVFNLVDPNGKSDEKMCFLQIPVRLLIENPDFVLENYQSDVILIVMYAGELSRIALPLLWKAFQEEETVLVYGDEDVKKTEDSPREAPWFKPDWSPDRFLSGFYFGAVAAVRTEALREAYGNCMAEGLWGEQEKFYLLLRELLKEKGCFAVRQREKKPAVLHVRQVLYHSRECGYEQIKDMRLPEPENPGWAGTKKQMLSIIIPSKDHPDILFRCLDSLLERTCSQVPFEMIVVDNGSTQENRKKVELKIAGLNGTCAGGGDGRNCFLECRYLYRPMPFNFSLMCNLGAQEAKGGLLLFLNDDMEIIQPDWMELMVSKAVLPYAGAVGAKLLYPGTDTIQHAGITNLRVGPAHKLQFLSDASVHYFGMNRGVHNMLAVTGACLMVGREAFLQAGGFCEELAVAFNDVDLCYRIYENGRYNIVRNDVAFYHHESLSRGKDGESEEKQLRLLREKDRLYERHQEIYGKDPFYHPYLTTDMLESEYSPAYRYQVTLDMPWAKIHPCREKVLRAREDPCLVVGMECAMDLYKWQYGVSPEKGKVKAEPKEMGYYFQGYSFVIGSDNACYKKQLLLKNRKDGDIYSIEIDSRYRPDIRDNLSDQKNVEMTGFAARMRMEEIPKGTYQFGMLAEELCSRQRLVNWSSWILEME